MKKWILILCITCPLIVAIGLIFFLGYSVFAIFRTGLSTAAVASTVAPIVTKSSTNTAAHLDKQLKAFYQRNTIVAYQKVGDHSSLWDKASLELLSGYVKSTTNQFDDPGTEWRVTRGREILAKGCKDPLIYYIVGKGLLDQNNANAAYPYLQQAVQGFKTFLYPRITARMAPMRLLDCLQQLQSTPEALQPIRDLAVQWSVAALTDSYYQQNERHLALFILQKNGNGLAEIQEPLLTALKKIKGFDTYITQCIEGDSEINLAWKARGNGWANTVTPQGWEGFSQHLTKARTVLTAAWKQHPEYPEAPTAMEIVAMADDKDDGRIWFDRAITAQFDYAESYDFLLSSLRPRWGGSQQQIYDFGLACLNTKRFDTGVPFYFFTANRSYIIADDGNMTYWKKPETYTHLKEMFNGYISAAKPEDRPLYQSCFAATAWNLRQYQDAGQLLDTLGARIIIPPYNYLWNSNFEDARDEIYANCQPYADLLKKVDKEASFQGNKPAQATYRRLLEKYQNNLHFSAVIKRRIATLK